MFFEDLYIIRLIGQALNRIGLRVVLDVVYNHIHGSGPSGIHSCLDKVITFSGHLQNWHCMHHFRLILTLGICFWLLLHLQFSLDEIGFWNCHSVSWQNEHRVRAFGGLIHSIYNCKIFPRYFCFFCYVLFSDSTQWGGLDFAGSTRVLLTPG